MSHSQRHRPEIVVGLVATPPDYPARVAARLTAELGGRLLTDASDERVPAAGWAPAELARRVAAIHRVVGEADAGELGYLASRLTGRLRLVTGMVRATQPGRALL